MMYLIFIKQNSQNREITIWSHIFVCRVKPGEPVCVDERATRGSPFFFIYQMVFKQVGLRLPFTPFERELLTEMNTAHAQLHPNSWAFVRGFQILCGYLGIPPSVDVFLHFFEVKKQGKSLWMNFSRYQMIAFL